MFFNNNSVITSNTTPRLSTSSQLSRNIVDQTKIQAVQGAKNSVEKSSERARTILNLQFYSKRTNFDSPSSSTALNSSHAHIPNEKGTDAVSSPSALQSECTAMKGNYNTKESLEVIDEYYQMLTSKSVEKDDIKKYRSHSCAVTPNDANECEESTANKTLVKTSDDNPMCPICLCVFEVGESVVWSKLKTMNGGCKHVFHHECFLPWAKGGHLRCPVCRDTIWSMKSQRAIRQSQVLTSEIGFNRSVAAGNKDTIGSKRELICDQERSMEQLENRVEPGRTLPSQQGRVNLFSGATLNRVVPIVESGEYIVSSTQMRQMDSVSKKQSEVPPWYQACCWKVTPLESIAEESNFCVICGLVSPCGDNS